MEEQHDQLYKIRHSLAHVMAQAVLEIRPGAKLGFGPPVDNGFYYDFLFDTPISSDDFKDIEKRMRKILEQKMPFVQSLMKRKDAIKLFAKEKEDYKVELIEGLPDEEVSIYTTGDKFLDLCRVTNLRSPWVRQGQLTDFTIN